MTDKTPLDSPKSLPKGVQLWEGSSAFVEQGRHWSSALIWISSGLFTVSILWAFTARVDQTISVRGELEPAGSVQDVDSPTGGVVGKVFVKDGDRVKQGQPLLDVEAEGLTSRRNAIERSLALFDLQARSLQTIVLSDGDELQMRPLPAVPNVDDPQLASQLLIARNQTQQLRSRLEQINTQLQSRRKSLRLKEQLAKDLQTLYENSAISRHNYLSQLDEVQSMNASVSALREEKNRVAGEAAAQLNQLNQQMINLRSELVGIKQTLGYRTVRAPISGTIFDTRVGPSSVVNTSELLLQVVPDNRLQARIKIPNADVGFVRAGLPVSVGVDSFSAGEFGYIKGTLISIGSDALAPTQPGQQPSFPAVVQLQQQEVLAGDQKLNLQSGMGVTANIKLRTRPAISLLTDMFTRQLEGIKRFR